jgi:hypothetical protein
MEKVYLKVSKNIKINLDIGNVGFYKPGKFQIELHHILGYEKVTKSDIYNSEQCKLSKSQNLSDFFYFMEP